MQIQPNYTRFNRQNKIPSFESSFVKTEHLRETLQTAQSSCYDTGYKRAFLNSMQYLLNDGKKKMIKLDSVIEKEDNWHKYKVETLKVNSKPISKNRKRIYDNLRTIGDYKDPSMDMIINYSNKALGSKPNPYDEFSQKEVSSIFSNFIDLVHNSSTYDKNFINKMESMPERIREGLDEHINTELQKIEKTIFGE